MKVNRIALFPSGSEEGGQLKNEIVRFLRENNNEPEVIDEELMSLHVRIGENGLSVTARQLMSAAFMAACLECDWVIVDLTREHNGINNFDIIGELPKHFSRVSIVSRNYLPVNMYDVDGRGYPSYTTKTMSNDEILRYVKWRYESDKLQREPAIARITYADIVVDQSLYGILLNQQIALYREQRSKSVHVFVSCRTHYQDRYENFPYRYSVNELVAMLNDGHRSKVGVDHLVDKSRYGGEIRAYSLNDGDLFYSDELLSRFRMWQIASFIDRYYIEPCSELWIYGSEDYWDSWWSRGEVLAFYYFFLNANDTMKSEGRKMIKVYDPHSHEIVRELSSQEDLLSCFRYDDAEFILKYLRIYSNYHIDSLGLETEKSIQLMRGNIERLQGVYSAEKSFQDNAYENLKHQLSMIRQYPEAVRELLSESSQDDQSMQFVAMVLQWSDDEMQQYLDRWRLVMEAMRDYSISNPDATQEEIYAEVAEKLVGDMTGIVRNMGISAVYAIKTGTSDAYPEYGMDDDKYYTRLSVVTPSAVSCDFDASRFPELSEEVIDAYFSPSDMAESDVHNPGLAMLDDEVLKKAGRNVFFNRCEASIRGKKYRVVKYDPRYVYIPKRLGGLIDWSRNHDCLEEIPVLCLREDG